MQRLFQATISFQQMREEKGRTGQAWMNMQVAPKGVLWWDKNIPRKRLYGIAGYS